MDYNRAIEVLTEAAEELNQTQDSKIWLHEFNQAFDIAIKLLENPIPQGKWLYPYYDNFIGKRRIGKAVKECSICNQRFGNNIPWNAKFCPNCGAEIMEN